MVSRFGYGGNDFPLFYCLFVWWKEQSFSSESISRSELTLKWSELLPTLLFCRIVFFCYREFKCPVASSLLMSFCLIQTSVIKPINSSLFWPIVIGCLSLEEAEAIWLEAANPYHAFLMSVFRIYHTWKNLLGQGVSVALHSSGECWNRL